ncbi:MAG: hypothetical protein EOO37_03675 [Cytophagaceae bacterium]|nr:MAG: hypothetical protein EOO37_03675 [Cytophagaceae bacterium]
MEISKDLRRYREYYAVLGFKIGSWQLLPPVSGVTLKYFSEITRLQAKYNARSTIIRSEEIVVMLSVPGSATGIIIGRFLADNVNTAIDFAHDTATDFNVPVNMYLPPNQFQPLHG